MNTKPTPPSGGLLAWLEQRINVTELFSFLTHFGLVHTPIDNRRPVREVMTEIDTTPVASYARWPHVLGVLAAILFGFEAVTGLLLAFYYTPSPDTAFTSTLTIVRELPFGGLIHQIHKWGAYLLIAIIAGRLIRLFWDGLYRAPREILWFASVVLLWLVLQLDFTGRLLTWNTKSYWATVRGLEVTWALPVVGPLVAFLLGGRTLHEFVLTRFYVLHIAVFPLLYALCIYLTFATLRRVGLSAPAPGSAPMRPTTFRQHRVDLAIIALFLFAVLVTLATLTPFPFLSAADPYSTPVGTRPPWYMLASWVVIQHTPGPQWIMGTLMLALAAALLLLPLWNRFGIPDIEERRLRWGGIALLALWVLLTVVGFVVDRR